MIKQLLLGLLSDLQSVIYIFLEFYISQVNLVVIGFLPIRRLRRHALLLASLLKACWNPLAVEN